MTVLVVEDQSSLAEPLQDLLEGQGHGCLTACDVDEAEWTVQTVHVDVLVLDLEVPGRSAREWLEELSLAKPELARSTVAITGAPAGTEEVMAIRASGASLLQKPFAIQMLHDAVRDKIRKVLVLQPSEVSSASKPWPGLDESEEH
jgi:DNA-binding response OmpR family regulator